MKKADRLARAFDAWDPWCYQYDSKGAMMGNLLVRDVSDDLVAQLKERARANGRSAEAEHREILRQAFCGDNGARFEELAAQLRVLTMGRRQTPAEDLLREMRDER